MILAIFACVLVVSCVSPQSAEESRDPFSKNFVADIQTVGDPTDLRQLIRSLPVWDCPPPECPPGWTDGWISRNGTMKGDTLFIIGDGAQIALRLTMLSADREFELETGTADWPEGGHSIYRLKRMKNGWQVLSRRGF